MELIDYASKRLVPALQELVAKALAQVLSELEEPKRALDQGYVAIMIHNRGI